MLYMYNYMYVCIYIYIYTHMCIYIYIYMHQERVSPGNHGSASRVAPPIFRAARRWAAPWADRRGSQSHS